MKCYVMSDIHIDFYSVQTRNYDTILPNFEDQYKRMFVPADAILIAGDVANDYYTQVMFYKFICTKYKDVFVTFGNHDLVVLGATFGNGNPFKTSEEKIQAIKNDMASYKNFHLLDGDVVNNIGGTMGMCDFSYQAHGFESPIALKQTWLYTWFDGRHWNYFKNDTDKILASEKAKIEKALEQKPKVMMTHFCPLQMGVQQCYALDTATAFFYFDGKEYLDKMEDGSYWICGHTHDRWKTDYVNKDGKTIHILCNPMGYPNENNNTSLNKEDYLIDV